MKCEFNKIKAVIVLNYLLPFLVGIGVILLAMYFDRVSKCDITHFYQDKMRGSLFAGFLTLGSFLLSLKTGIVIKIKENIYDKDSYQLDVSNARKEGTETGVYDPLKRLTKLLSAAVLAALIASVSQFTIGLISSPLAVSLCLGIAAIALIFLFEAFWVIQLNLQTWFEYLEREFETKQLNKDKTL